MGAGVRHAQLRERLGPELRRIWGITSKDLTEVMELTIVRLDQSLSDLPKPDLARTARVAYNLDPDPDLVGLLYMDRIKALSGRLGPKNSVRTLERHVKSVREHIGARLARAWPPVPADALRRVRARERAARSPAPTDDSRLLASIGSLLVPRDPVEESINEFLAGTMLVPRDAENRLALARTAAHGDWVCAFSSPHRFDEYRREVIPPWGPQPLPTTGADLLRKLRQERLRAGILVNPEAARNAAPVATLPLSPQLVEQISGRLP
ncbi:hypothetical protein GCM10010470_61790 [Saccharopolyspora taberi]|uniref:Uncharacterized protein n=1 Tax=Saccharopolyspora taberi TaxID=60895 RepID=A0ABN3VLU8_9PSEU